MARQRVPRGGSRLRRIRPPRGDAAERGDGDRPRGRRPWPLRRWSQAGLGEGGLAGADGLVVAVEVGEGLEELDAAAVAVHVAEAADVHEDVEAEAVASGEGAQQLVVAAAVFGAEPDEFGERGARAGRRRGGGAGARSSGTADRGATWPVRPQATQRLPRDRRRERVRWAGRPSIQRRRLRSSREMALASRSAWRT